MSDGKGKAPQWRLTELKPRWPTQRNQLPDYKKWDGTPFDGNQIWRGRGQKPKKQNPGRETTSRVDAKQRPVLDAKQRPPHASKWTRNNVHIGSPPWTAKQRPYLG